MIQPIMKTMVGKEDGAVEMEMVSAAWRQRRVLMKCSLMSSSPAFFLVVVEVILVETPRRQGSAVAVKAAAMVEDEACSLHLGFPCSLNRLPEVGFAFL